MHEVIRGVLIAAAVVVAAWLVAWGIGIPPFARTTAPAMGATIEAVVIGPDGKAETPYGEDLANVEVPGSAAYSLCVGDLTVKRPSMMVSSMPDSFCRLSRAADGKWLISTGGWQECRVSCFKIVGG